MATLAPTDASVAGVAENLVPAAGGGDVFPNNGLCLLVVNNGGAGAIDVTVDDPGSATPVGATAFNPDVTINVPAGTRRTIGPFPPWRFNNSSGQVSVTYSGVATVTVGVIRILP